MREDYLEILKQYDGQMAETARLVMNEAGTAFPGSAPDALVCAVMPNLTYYVEWTLKQAQADGVRRLYFLARDGYLMYRMASELCMSRNIPVECRYLYGSRYAWRIPWYHLDRDGCLEKVCLDGLDVSFRSMLERAGLGAGDALQIASRYWPECSKDELDRRIRERIPRVQLKEWKERLRTDQSFWERVDQLSRAAYESTTGYLRQEGLFEEIRYGIVDSGWVGSIQATLEKLLESAGCPAKPEGYYYGLYSLPDGADASRFHTCYFSPCKNLKNKVYFNNCLYECIYSSPEGSCMGYVWQEGEEMRNGEWKKGFWRPVLAAGQAEEEGLEGGEKSYSEGNPNRERIQVTEAVLEIWMRFYRQEGKRRESYSRGESAVTEGCDKRSIRCQRALWKRLMCRPNVREAEYFGEYRFSDDVGGEERKEAAEFLSNADLKEMHIGRRLLRMAGIGKGSWGKGSAWMEGSIVRNGTHVERELWNETVHKYLLYGGKELLERVKRLKGMGKRKG